MKKYWKNRTLVNIVSTKEEEMRHKTDNIISVIAID